MENFELYYKVFAVAFTIAASIILVLDKSPVKKELTKSKTNKFKSKCQ